MCLCLGWAAAVPAQPLRIDEAAGPIQEEPGCRGPTAAFCDLRIYQVMVESFVDGDPGRDYGDGYGPSHHAGDLRGVIDSLDYIAGLGMNAIWLTPIFDSHAGEPQKRLDGSSHVDLKLDATGYYPRNYFAIDPRFGTLDDARELVEQAHARGLYVFLDGVFGHHKGDLVRSPTGRLPVDSTDPADYGGNPSGYPGRVVDYDAPETLAFYREVAVYWIETLGIDGWRLDQAYQVPPAAWREIRAAVEAAAAARRRAGQRWGTLGYLVAEVFAGADDIARDAFGSALAPILDSAFDFPLRWATVGVLAGEENGLSRRPASTLDEPWAYGAHSDIYRPGALPNLMLGNHDFVRFGDLLQRVDLAEPQDPEWWARHRLAMLVQAAYSGPVTRYYGEEIGDEVPGFADRVTGDCASRGLCDDHVARSSAKIPGVSVPADGLSPEQGALVDYHARLMAARAAHPALSRGSRQHLHSDDDLYIDLKDRDGQEVVFAMNAGDSEREVLLARTLFRSPSAQAWDLLEDTAVPFPADGLALTLPPLSGRLVLLDAGPAGAPAVNAGMTDAWFDPSTNGQGILLTVFPDTGLVFLAWFTYDTERPDPSATAQLGEPGHRWLTALGPLQGNRAHLEVFLTAGAVFDSAQPTPSTSPAGWIELEFSGCNRARLEYRIDTPPRAGVIDLQRIALDKTPLCEALSAD